jgi:haloalkane dehalogenase
MTNPTERGDLAPGAVYRTPDERFEGLPDWVYQPRWRELDGLRLAHVDEGDGLPVVFLHGEPTWSFLWRHVLVPVRDAGFRCVAPDLAGFGRSDKPTDIGWYTYDRHTEHISHLLDHLDLRDVTLVVHDWGGPIGLRLAVERPERISRLVITDTGIFTGTQRMTDTWLAFREVVRNAPALDIGRLVRAGCARDPGDDVIAAYDAPFPNEASKAGARAFPELIPFSPDAPGAAAGRRTLEGLRNDRRPTLLLWGDSDPVLPLRTGERFAEAIGKPAPQPIEGAGHFLQEDQGQLIGRLIADWLTG